MSAVPDYLQPAALARRPLYAPLATLLAACGERLPSLMQLNQAIGAAGEVRSGRGVPVRFVAPGAHELPYEHAVFDASDVETRPDNWHDFFNALVWAAFPRAKAALNARHMHELTLARAMGRKGRGAVRDALTQFDECGLVVLGACPELLEALTRHAWAEVFWHSRAALLDSTRFILFGHASYDQLRTPFPGLCAKALYLSVPEPVVRAPVETQVALVDTWLARYLGTVDDALSPRRFAPLPLLGIPDVVRENARRGYYADAAQFRPLGDRAPVPVHDWRPRLVEAL
ncbi:DUF3025 domain-containing protein [Nitrogeniibacter mangrovi]|uniref:DUF3025 domain-containing protein n=1 Tax=Nitrogeniibacter mangrovi TaxID=2016596 RepID=A0A6C1B094_9RHOO|nr:DUF3025 domain-containing protein [Nitrogeniibacter mangrovi]QID17026.1 DUF3025 domain-containing protein [Nitrogeniibacter mangrovi]